MTLSSSELSSEPRLDLAVLKSWNFDDHRLLNGGRLPYRMDHLERQGFRLHWTDRPHGDQWTGSRTGRLLRRLESATVPFAQTLILAPRIRRCSATLALFESEGNFLAIARHLSRRSRRSPFVVMTSWLSELLRTGGRLRRQQYRWAYKSVDVVYYLSRNQRAVLEDTLGLAGERLRYLPFGVDTETFRPPDGADGGYLLAVGRDRARDWPTFFEAARDLDMPVKVCCRPSQIKGIAVPDNVEVLGYVDRGRYRELLGAARVVAVLARPVEYPSGQSVLLEAMAMGRTVVVTSTPALADYLRDGVDCLAIPSGDPDAARQRIVEAASDDQLRVRIGTSARQIAEAKYDSARMWASIARDLRELVGAGR